MPVSVNKHSFYLSFGHATRQQKVQSSLSFGALKADFPTRILIRRNYFFTDTGTYETFHPTAERGIAGECYSLLQRVVIGIMSSSVN